MNSTLALEILGVMTTANGPLGSKGIMPWQPQEALEVRQMVDALNFYQQSNMVNGSRGESWRLLT